MQRGSATPYHASHHHLGLGAASPSPPPPLVSSSCSGDSEEPLSLGPHRIHMCSWGQRAVPIVWQRLPRRWLPLVLQRQRRADAARRGRVTVDGGRVSGRRRQRQVPAGAGARPSCVNRFGPWTTMALFLSYVLIRAVAVV